MDHLSTEMLLAQLDHILEAPSDGGTLELIVRRPGEEQREELDEAVLDEADGLVGDDWSRRGSRTGPNGGPSPDRQVTVMNARVAAVLARVPERRALAGDQLYVDLDLSDTNLPAGTRLAIGSAVLEVTEAPHTGCAKFRRRFGEDALRFVNSDVGKQHHLRGINTRVLQAGTIHRGDTVRKV
jgi:MOSC domain-containing protein YiiM